MIWPAICCLNAASSHYMVTPTPLSMFIGVFQKDLLRPSRAKHMSGRTWTLSWRGQATPRLPSAPSGGATRASTGSRRGLRPLKGVSRVWIRGELSLSAGKLSGSVDMLLEWLFFAASCLVMVASALGMRATAMKDRERLVRPMNSLLLIPSHRALSGDWSWLFNKDEKEEQEPRH